MTHPPDSIGLPIILVPLFLSIFTSLSYSKLHGSGINKLGTRDTLLGSTKELSESFQQMSVSVRMYMCGCQNILFMKGFCFFLFIAIWISKLKVEIVNITFFSTCIDLLLFWGWGEEVSVASIANFRARPTQPPLDVWPVSLNRAYQLFTGTKHESQLIHRTFPWTVFFPFKFATMISYTGLTNMQSIALTALLD